MILAQNPNRYPPDESHNPRISGIVSDLPIVGPHGTGLGEQARLAWQQAQVDERHRRRREAEEIRTRQASDLVEACRRILQVSPQPREVRFDGEGRAQIYLDGYTFRGGQGDGGPWLLVADAFDCWHHVVDLGGLGRLIEERELTRVVRR